MQSVNNYIDNLYRKDIENVSKIHKELIDNGIVESTRLDILRNIRWDASGSPEEATQVINGLEHEVDLSERVFTYPVFLIISGRYGENGKRIAVVDTTIGGILQAISDYVTTYEDACNDAGIRGMGDRTRFEGLVYSSPFNWRVIFGS